MDNPQYAIEPGTYWAVQEDRAMPAAILEHFKKYYEKVTTHNRVAMWRRACSLYFGKDGKGGFTSAHEVSFQGKQGEVVAARSNHFRSLVRRMHTMITEQRPEFEISTINDSGDALAQATLARSLLDYYMDDGKVEAAARAACERALVVAEAYVHQFWDVDAGPVAIPAEAVEDSRPRKLGDIRTEAVSPWDVAFDLDIPSGTEPSWMIVRRYMNRWDLAAKLPTIAKDLANYQMSSSVDRGVWEESEPRTGASDWIPCLYFYHAKTPALPKGRMMIVVSDLVIFSGPLPYDEIPVYRIAPCEEFDTNLGYSDSWDLMALQQIYDSVVTSMFSLHDAYAMPNMLVDKGSNLSVKQLSGGLRKVEWDSKGGTLSPPEPMKFPQIPETSFKLRETVRQDMEVNFGINAVARGEAAPEATSGSHAALIQSMAIQYASGLVYAYIKLLRTLGYKTIRLLQTFADDERDVAIVGPDNAYMFQSFTSKSLDKVRQIRVEMGSAQMRTFQQRREIATELADKFEGQITIEQYLAFYATGRIEPLYRHQKSEVLAIRRENEALAKGMPLKVVVLDHHMLHIREHSCLLHNPDIRFNDAASAPILAHIQEHIRQLTILQMANPALLLATGQQVPAAPLPPQGAPQEPGSAGAAPAPERSDGGPEKPKGKPKAAPPGVPDNDNLPAMPNNPATGTPAAPNGGTS